MKKKLPSIITILILTLITCVFWVSFSIYRVFSSKPDAKIQIEDAVLKPITPNLDTSVITQLEGTIDYEEN